MINFSTDGLQFNQRSLLSPLPPILTNQSYQGIIMTHCLADAVTLDASNVACMSVNESSLFILDIPPCKVDVCLLNAFGRLKSGYFSSPGLCAVSC